MEKFETEPLRPIEVPERQEALLWDLIKDKKEDKSLIKLAHTLAEAQGWKNHK